MSSFWATAFSQPLTLCTVACVLLEEGPRAPQFRVTWGDFREGTEIAASPTPFCKLSTLWSGWSFLSQFSCYYNIYPNSTTYTIQSSWDWLCGTCRGSIRSSMTGSGPPGGCSCWRARNKPAACLVNPKNPINLMWAAPVEFIAVNSFRVLKIWIKMPRFQTKTEHENHGWVQRRKKIQQYQCCMNSWAPPPPGAQSHSTRGEQIHLFSFPSRNLLCRFLFFFFFFEAWLNPDFKQPELWRHRHR